MRALLFAVAMTCSSFAMAEKLTIDRIWSDPDLNGPAPRGLKLAPDGARVTFLRGRQDDQNQLDLWQYDIASAHTRLLVDSTALGEPAELSDAEAARRERARIAGLKGIVGYRFAQDGRKILFGIGQRLWMFDFDAPEGKALRALTPLGLELTDAKVSPRGRYVSFVSEQNLFTIDLVEGGTRQLTRDGAGPIHNAEAEFVAQEEMDRNTGYWWAPDDSQIAFARYDESGVDLVTRSEIDADQTRIIKQRYPAAGRANVTIKLGLVKPRGGNVRWVDIDANGKNTDIYLARVDWLPDAQRLSFQRESRDQRTLDLMLVDTRHLKVKPLLRETRDTWINLNDDLRFLEHDDAFVWTSDRNGFAQLYLYGLDGQLRHPLTGGNADVDKLLAIDEAGGRMYFASNRDDALSKQVYSVALDGSDADTPRRISQGDGWHDATFGRTSTTWIDNYSDPNTPPQVSLRSADGNLIAWIEHNELKPGHPYWSYQAAHITAEFGTLKATDGQTLYYEVFKPAGFNATQRYPVFMTYYGGPGRQYVNRVWGNHFEQYMAQHGYVVFALDNRGTPRRGRQFSDAIFRQLGKVEIADQRVGIDWLNRQPWINGKRIGVFGWSYGGYMSLLLLAKESVHVAAGVAVAPVTDWALYDTHYTERFLDTPEHNPRGYEKSSVFHWLDGMRSPLLLVHGMADDNVLFVNSTRLMTDLQQRGVQFELMTYPGARHGLSSPAEKKHVHHLIADFLDRKLKPQATARD